MRRALAVMLFIATPVFADTIGPWPDTPISRFFKSLMRPGAPKTDESQSCCGVADVVKDTKFKVEFDQSGHPYPTEVWYAWLNGKWVRIPDNKIVPDYAPDGHGYLFAAMALTAMAFDDPDDDAASIMCFVRPRADH